MFSTLIIKGTVFRCNRNLYSILRNVNVTGINCNDVIFPHVAGIIIQVLVDDKNTQRVDAYETGIGSVICTATGIGHTLD